MQLLQPFLLIHKLLILNPTWVSSSADEQCLKDFQDITAERKDHWHMEYFIIVEPPGAGGEMLEFYRKAGQGLWTSYKWCIKQCKDSVNVYDGKVCKLQGNVICQFALLLGKTTKETTVFHAQRFHSLHLVLFLFKISWMW